MSSVDLENQENLVDDETRRKDVCGVYFSAYPTILKYTFMFIYYALYYCILFTFIHLSVIYILKSRFPELQDIIDRHNSTLK